MENNAPEQELKHLYAHYLMYCAEQGVEEPIPYAAFRQKTLDRIHNENHHNHDNRTFYVASRVNDPTPDNHDTIFGGPPIEAESVVRQCAQCQQDVWVDKQHVKQAEQVAIVCTVCLPELTGLTAEQVLAAIEHDTDHHA